MPLQILQELIPWTLADKFTETLKKAFEIYGDTAEEYMAGKLLL